MDCASAEWIVIWKRVQTFFLSLSIYMYLRTKCQAKNSFGWCCWMAVACICMPQGCILFCFSDLNLTKSTHCDSFFFIWMEWIRRIIIATLATMSSFFINTDVVSAVTVTTQNAIGVGGGSLLLTSSMIYLFFECHLFIQLLLCCFVFRIVWERSETDKAKE